MAIKKYIFWTFIATETIIFCFYYTTGAHGLRAIEQLKNETSAMTNNIDILKNTLVTLDEDIDALKNHSWPKEKIAREDLQMAYPNEEIFLL